MPDPSKPLSTYLAAALSWSFAWLSTHAPSTGQLAAVGTFLAGFAALVSATIQVARWYEGRYK